MVEYAALKWRKRIRHILKICSRARRWKGTRKITWWKRERGWKGVTEEKRIRTKSQEVLSRVSSYKGRKLKASSAWQKVFIWYLSPGQCFISSFDPEILTKAPREDIWPVRQACASDKLHLPGKTKGHIFSEKLILHLHTLKEIPLGLPSLPSFPSFTKTLTLRCLWSKSAFITKRKRNFTWTERNYPWLPTLLNLDFINDYEQQLINTIYCEEIWQCEEFQIQ